MTVNVDSTSYNEDETFLTNAFGDQYLYSVNRQVFNTSGADAVYREYLPDIFWNKNSLFIVVGTDSGLLIEHVIKHGVPSGSRYLFVELSSIFNLVSQRLKTEKPDTNIVLTKPSDWINEAEQAGYLNYLYLNHIYVIKSQGSFHTYRSEYIELSLAITNVTTSWEWQLRSQYAKTRFIECQLINATENQTPVSVLKNSFKGKTAVLLASGPSLDDFLPWIKEHRNKLLVTAISRTSRRLLDVGIKPDIVFTIDPYNISYAVSKEMLMFDSDVLLVNSSQALPRLVAQWRGPQVYLGSRLPWLDEADNPGDGLTVSNAAIKTLIWMGVSQIILTGVDLCFNSNGAQYSAGNNESDVGPALGHIGPKVEINAGYKAETSEDYLLAIQSLSEQALEAKENGCTLTNPAPGAARIHNVQFRPIENISFEALSELPSLTLSKYLPPNDKNFRLKHYHKLDQELASAAVNIKQVQTLANEVVHCINKLFGRCDKKPDLSAKEQIIQIEKELETKYPNELNLVKHFAIRDFLRFVGRSKIGQRKITEVENDGRTYYQALCDSAQKLLEITNYARQRTYTRISEEDEEPNFNSLFEQWHLESDYTPWRLLLWKLHNPKAFSTLTQEQKAIYQTEVSRFEREMKKPIDWHMQECQKKASLDNVPNKIKLLFSQNDTEGLRNLVNGLAKISEDEAQTLMHFAAGCLSELEKYYDKALVNYQKVPEGPLLEDALRHISHLCIQLGNAPNALLALECLSHMSISYVPTYAEVAWHAGHVKEAMELFTQYLEQVPTDMKTYIRLGILYLKQGIMEGARLAFSHVLEQDPDNIAAKNLLVSLDEDPVKLKQSGGQ